MHYGVMLNMKEINISRPVTVRCIAEAIGLEPYELMADLIRLDIFAAPDQEIDDESAVTITEARFIKLTIVEGKN